MTAVSLFVDYDIKVKNYNIGLQNWPTILDTISKLKLTFATKTVDDTARASVRTGPGLGSGCSGDARGSSESDIEIGYETWTFVITSRFCCSCWYKYRRAAFPLPPYIKRSQGLPIKRSQRIELDRFSVARPSRAQGPTGAEPTSCDEKCPGWYRSSYTMMMVTRATISYHCTRYSHGSSVPTIS
jgi:hypothetical protein